MIYFVHAVGTDLIKIGYTSGNVRKRVDSLQTGCPHKLRIVATMKGGKDVERRWHDDFAASRTHGEWFRTSDRLTKAIGIQPLKAQPTKPVRQEETWVISFNDRGLMDYAGKVITETRSVVSIESVDALLAYFGPVYLSGESRDAPQERCRFYSELDDFLLAFGVEAERLDRDWELQRQMEKEARDLELCEED